MANIRTFKKTGNDLPSEIVPLLLWANDVRIARKPASPARTLQATAFLSAVWK